MATERFRTIAPAVSGVEKMSLPPMSASAYACGMQLHVYRRMEEPFVGITVVGTGGSAEARTPGVGVLTCSMQREGTATLSGFDISDNLDYNGAWMKNAMTSHHLRHTLYCLAGKLPAVLPVLARIIGEPSYPVHELDVRREAMAKSLEVAQANVGYQARCVADAQMMGARHPLALTDTPQAVRDISRNELVDFHSKAFTRNGIHIFLFGHVTDEAERMVAETFHDIIPMREGHCPVITPFIPDEPQSRRHVLMPASTQSAVVLTLPAVSRSHPDYLPLQMAVYALGGFFGSRLMLNIREEKGLTYGIAASLYGYIDGAFVDISAETTPENVDRLIEEVRGEMVCLANNPPRGEELQRIRQSALSAQSSVLDTPISIAAHHTAIVTQGLPPDYFEAKTSVISSITPDKIAEMAERYLSPDGLRIATAGR